MAGLQDSVTRQFFLRYVGSAVLMLALISVQPWQVRADEAMRHPVSGLAVKEVRLISSGGAEIKLHLEVADSPKARRKGLMWRRQLSEKGGMIFIWPVAAPRAFWMKDTPLSLDILFFDASGQLVSAYERTEPLSLTSLPSNGLVRFVVELGAGRAEVFDLGAGSQLVLEKWMTQE